MTITFDGTTIVTSPDVVSNWRPSWRRDMQPRKRLRAEYTIPISRSNTQHQLSFDATKLHADPATAMQWATSLERGLSESGTLQINWTLTGTNEYLHDAVLISADPIVRGATTFTTFHFTGSKISETAPA